MFSLFLMYLYLRVVALLQILKDLKISVEHIGFGAGDNLLTLFDVSELADNDYIQVGDEIMQITDVRETTKQVVVTRAQKGTVDEDHYHREDVSLDIPDFRFL